MNFMREVGDTLNRLLTSFLLVGFGVLGVAAVYSLLVFLVLPITGSEFSPWSLLPAAALIFAGVFAVRKWNLSLPEYRKLNPGVLSHLAVTHYMRSFSAGLGLGLVLTGAGVAQSVLFAMLMAIARR